MFSSGSRQTILNVGGVGKLLAVLLPHGFEFPATLNVAQNGGHIRNLPGGAAMGCGGVQRFGKHSLIKFLRGCQYVRIVKISGAGIEHTPPQDSFYLLRHDGFDVVCPQLVGFFVIENF